MLLLLLLIGNVDSDVAVVVEGAVRFKLVFDDDKLWLVLVGVDDRLFNKLYVYEDV